MKRLWLIPLLACLLASPAWAATIFADNFTGSDGTSILSSTPETGTGWTGIDTSQGLLIATNAIYMPNDSTGKSLYSADATYSTANYTITIMFNLFANPGTAGGVYWIGCRYDATGGIDGYFAWIEEGAGTNDVRIYRVDNGTPTKISSTEDTNPVNTDTFVLECNGSAIGLKKNGSYVISPITDATYSAAGKAIIGAGEILGITEGRGTGASSITQFTVEDIPGAATSPRLMMMGVGQ